MSIMKEIEKELNFTTTENGDVAYKSTLNANLDFFGIAGASRYRQDNVKDMFKKAMKEDLSMAVKNLFHLRSIRGGLGERESFRTGLEKLIDKYPKVAIALLPFIPEYGRWDDVLVYLEEDETEQIVANFIKEQLEEDLKNKREGKPITLCAKWMPSINASNSDVRQTALKLIKLMGMDKKTYRKILSELRNGIIVEKNLTEKDYSFDYAHVPGRAFKKYLKAYRRNDNERFEEFKTKLKSGEVKAKVETLFPHEIIRDIYEGIKDLDDEALKILWDALERSEDPKNTIVVRDGSGSMYGEPLFVATALAILYSEQLIGDFKDKFITFSNNPRFVDLSCAETLREKVAICRKETEIASTNIEAVYNLLYNASLKIKDEKEYIERVVIISDMQFNCGATNVPTYESMKEKFELAGIPLPEIVYWNVEARTVTFAADASQPNIRFVSGMSNSIISDLIHNKSMSAYDHMIKTLSKYSFVDDVLSQIQY